ncbi:MAG: hypothetical protein HRT35_02175 [Algicola sp.]|nr:hypothetical protein [Algicola sp.]
MNLIEQIDNKLERMTVVLRACGNDNWADAIQNVRCELLNDRSTARTKVFSMYGGMGSLNDLVLYKNGNPMIKENIEFDGLRSELYNLCQSL